MTALLAVAPAASAAGFSPVTHYQEIKQADSLANAGKFAEAAALYSKLTAEDPLNGELWIRQGNTYSRAGQPRKAIAAYLKVKKLGFENTYKFGIGLFERDLAALYAQVNEPDSAMDWLEAALDNHLTGRTELWADKRFESLQRFERFKMIAGVPLRPVTGRTAQWRADIDFVLSETQRLHATPYRDPARSPRFISQAQNIKQMVPQWTDNQIEIALKRLIASLESGHSYFLPRGGWDNQDPFPQVELWNFDDGHYIVGGDDAAGEHIGAKVLKIGGVPIDTLRENVVPLIARDYLNPQQAKWDDRLIMLFPSILHAFGALPNLNAKQIPFAIKDRDGTKSTIQVPLKPGIRSNKLQPPTTTTNPVPLWLQRPDDWQWAVPVPEIDAVWFQFNQIFDNSAAGLPGPPTMAAFADDLWEMLKSTNAHNLIIDVRRNNGGTVANSPDLLRVAAAFKRMDKSNRLFVVTGRGTFSSTPVWTGELERLIPDTIFVGEPAGGAPNMTGSESSLTTLPYSKFTMNISFAWWGANPRNVNQPYIPVDIPVDITAEDYFTNHDPVFDALSGVIHGGS